MLTELFRVPMQLTGRLMLGPRPRGGDWLEDELRGWHAAGVETVVSLLTPDEAESLGLELEAEAAAKQGIRFRAFPIPDRDVPGSMSAFGELIAELLAEVAAGRAVAVHCRQGIGRAGLVAAAVLISSGTELGEALARVSAARGRPIPETAEQRHWLERFSVDRLQSVGSERAEQSRPS